MGRSRLVLGRAALLCAAAAAVAWACCAAAAQGACDANADASCAAASSSLPPLPAPDSLDYFPGVPKRVLYKGPGSDDPFSYRYYNADEEVCAPAPASGGDKKQVCKPMKDWLRLSIAFWHSFRSDGSDPFGAATKRWPWGAAVAANDPRLDEMQLAFRAMHANFQLLEILGLELWSFHDRCVRRMRVRGLDGQRGTRCLHRTNCRDGERDCATLPTPPPSRPRQRTHPPPPPPPNPQPNPHTNTHTNAHAHTNT